VADCKQKSNAGILFCCTNSLIVKVKRDISTETLINMFATEHISKQLKIMVASLRMSAFKNKFNVRILLFRCKSDVY